MADLLARLVVLAVATPLARAYTSLDYWEERHSKEAKKGYQWLFDPVEVEQFLESLFPGARAPVQPPPAPGSPLHLCELGFGSSLIGADVLFGSSKLFPDRHVTLVDFSESAVRLMQERLLARHKPGDDAADAASPQPTFAAAFPGLRLVRSPVEDFLAEQSKTSTEPCDFLFDSSLFDTLLTGSGDVGAFVAGAFGTLSAAVDRRRTQSSASEEASGSAIWISSSYNLPAKRIREFARKPWSHMHSCRRAVNRFEGESHHFYINVIGDLPLGIQEAIKAAEPSSATSIPEYALMGGVLLCKAEDAARYRDEL